MKKRKRRNRFLDGWPWSKFTQLTIKSQSSRSQGPKSLRFTRSSYTDRRCNENCTENCYECSWEVGQKQLWWFNLDSIWAPQTAQQKPFETQFSTANSNQQAAIITLPKSTACSPWLCIWRRLSKLDFGFRGKPATSYIWKQSDHIWSLHPLDVSSTSVNRKVSNIYFISQPADWWEEFSVKWTSQFCCDEPCDKQIKQVSEVFSVTQILKKKLKRCETDTPRAMSTI